MLKFASSLLSSIPCSCFSSLLFSSLFFPALQYNQAPRKSKLCLANFALRLALNKILPFMFSPPAFFLITNNPNMTYKEVSEINEWHRLIDIDIDIGIDVEWSHRCPALPCPVRDVYIQPSDVTEPTASLSLSFSCISLTVSHPACSTFLFVHSLRYWE